jgi:hypothetical protein
MRTTLSAIVLAIAFLAASNLSLAQAGVPTFLTVGAISQGLRDALTGVQNATMTAGGEARSVGNSLQANVQNVLADIDAKFANRSDVMFSKLDGAERQFMSDARDLIYRTQAAAKALAPVIGDEARRTIGEADIAAYNTSYSLPCRTQMPRIVYWLPTSQTAKGEEVIVEIHGNFLGFGDEPRVSVGSRTVPQFTRNDRVISVKLPRELIQGITEKSSVAIAVSGLHKRVVEPRWYWFGCGESLEDAQTMSVTVALVPRVSYQVSGHIWATYKTWSDPVAFQSGTLDRGSDDCDTQTEVGFQVCVPDPANMRAVRGEGSVLSASKPSSWGPPTLSGLSCINFPAHLGGSGYDNLIFAKNCKGSAWLKVNWTAVGQRHDIKGTDPLRFDQNLPIGTYSYSISDDQQPIGDEWSWRYVVQVDQMRGSQILQSESLSDARMDNGSGWISSIKDGVLTLTMPSNPD